MAIFNRAFPVEDLQGAVPRLSPDVEGDVCPLLEALVDEAAMKVCELAISTRLAIDA